jgi:Tfp pilus assembly protein PilV
MRKRATQSVRGVTILEVLISIFVLLVGVMGIMALFPVGVRFSQMSSDDAISAMTAQNALAAVRVQVGLLERVEPHPGANLKGDVLSWLSDASRGIDGGEGSVDTDGVADEFNTGDPDRFTHMGVAFGTGTDSNTFVVRGGAATEDDRGLMLVTSGKAMWKLYRLDRDTDYGSSKVTSTNNGDTNFPGDGIEEGDEFRLLGARSDNHEWATVPARFYEDGPPYTLGEGAASGYGYLAIVNRVAGVAQAYRVTILVYKGYDEDLPPEANEPAIACYVTILSSDLLR